MSLTNNHFTIVLGIDIHFNTLPPFNPLHPFIGLVLDPMDYIPFIGATVQVNGRKRGVSDTSGMLVFLRHFPLFTGPFVETPFIAHESVNFFGSHNTHAEGRLLSPTTYLKMTCNDIGIPLSLHPGKNWKPIPSLFAPTSFSIPVPTGPPVNLGGPYVPDLMGLLINLVASYGFGALMKMGGKAVNKVLGRKAAKELEATADKAASKSKCAKDPVNMVTGHVLYVGTDFELPGMLPLQWERHWHSDSGYKGLLGHGTTCLFDAQLKIMDVDEVAMLMPDGRGVGFMMPLPGEESYNRVERLTLYRYADHFEVKDQASRLTYVFNKSHQLAALRNEQGFAITAEYTSGMLSRIIDSAGRVLTVRTDEAGRIVDIATDQQQLVAYTYNDAGDLCRITDALQQSTVLEYERHHLVKKTDRNGQSFYWEYDGHRCTRTWGDGGLLEGLITYHDGYNVLRSPSGRVDTFHYNEDLLCTQVTDSFGNSRFLEYTEYEELYRVIDEEGNMKGYRYDERGNCISVQYADKTEEQFLYDAEDRLTMYTDATGYSTVKTYTDAGLPDVVISADNAITSYQYDEWQRLSVVERGQQKTQLAYDAQHNLVKVVLPDGNETRWDYDALGRCIRRVNAAGGVQSFVYDLLGRPTRIQQPDGNVVWLQYNAYEEVVHARDSQHEVSFDYTPLGSLRRRTEKGASLQFQYNGEEELVVVTNEARERYRFERNARGEIVEEVGFDGRSRRYERAANGWVKKIMRPDNRFTEYEHDGNGRMVRATYHDGRLELYGYNKNGQLTSAINSEASVYFRHDIMGRVMEEKTELNGQTYVVESAYNKQGARTSLKSSLGADLQMRYTPLNQLQDMQASQGAVRWGMRLGYNALGQETDRWLPGGLSVHMEYDHAGHPLRQVVRSGSRDARKRRYDWDANERLVTMFNELTNGFVTYGHDAFGNLAWATYENGQRQYKSPDVQGNVYNKPDHHDRRYEAGGQLDWDQGWHYHYDAEGNLMEKNDGGATSWKYDWNANGTLREVTRPDGTTVSFTYDALGRRLEKVHGDTVTRWLWDGNVPIQEWHYAAAQRPVITLDALGDLQVSHPEPVEDLVTWVFNDGSFVPAAKLTTSGAYSIVTDYLGTPVEMYDETGRQAWACELDIYGKARTLVKGSITDCPFRFQGQYEDVETGLCYNRFRYYDPARGNYISQDPIGLQGGVALYGYVHDSNAWIDELGLSTNPITFTDSNGFSMQVSGYTDISHMSDEQLKALYYANDNALKGKGFGLSGVDKQGNTIVLHHYKQNPNGPIVALPGKHHDKPHVNPGQHPFGKKKGGGLTADERAAFNKWKQEYWKSQAATELNNRGIAFCH
ncbi:hypothetical protein DCC81_14145 [Chitinophaga parva]|uniref:Uncharacterized protein n=1 Tax=Chitinophaga parva TaxID=2169414 RepID=A0A2T7BGL6_9BACT|nr:RHS repeat-associated core domain-containing protein [Chitinophaga parva]PUZ25428.1 hypothetical protein DCC81_14145 [Chitinophaga parva]